MSGNDDQRIDWESFAGMNDDQIELKAREILDKMTIEEKLSQMSGDLSLLRGGIPMLIRYNKKPIPAGEVKRLSIPPILFSDGPRGVVMGNSTCFPVSMARGATWDVALEERIGNVIGIEARAQGANFFGGVCINLLRHPSWGRAQETYGEDPFHVGMMGAALVRGTQKHVMACAKHYAANSMENARFKVNVLLDERTLREVYLPHFKKCVDEGVASIMSAYNKVNGHYCGQNEHLLRDILKNDWNFKGFVISDFVFGVRNGKEAVNAGLDIEMPFSWKMKPSKLNNLLKKGKITEEQINDSVLRILRQKIRFTRPQNPKIYSLDKVACEEHVQLALEAARKSMTLLKNENDLLPLDRKKVKRIAVIGRLARTPNIGDLGSSRVYPPHVVTPLEGIKKAAGNEIEITHHDGKNLKQAINIAREADVVIIVAGFTHRDEGEFVGRHGGDRTRLALRQKDEEMILEMATVNKNCIVVLEGGSAIIMERWKDKVPAILMAWYPGMEGGTAIADVIFGNFNPSGKLPLTFPSSLEQLPFFDKNAKSIRYEYYHGYKLLEKSGNEPAFPFGFGLSYTTYSYNNLLLSDETIKPDGSIIVKVDVTNSGNVAGEEIVQAYIGYKESLVERPLKELKGFYKIHLKPGETKTVTMTVNAKDLAYYDAENGRWEIEKIEHVLMVGPSSRTSELLTKSFRIQE
ncbi:MAG: glycoside hydrolase family 3 C-terminal domain-containing protein [Candidatus Helarchaeales archaeon]